jgi:hypothetical protein
LDSVTPVTVLEDGGWLGVDDRLTQKRPEGLLLDAQNVVFMPGITGGMVVRPRPAFRTIPHAAPGVSSYNCQCLAEYLSNGAPMYAGVWNGEIWSWNQTSGWEQRVTAANFATAGITRTATYQWFACFFNGKLIFNDQFNRPFSWDGTTGAGGLASLTNGPAQAVGAPTVYYAKLFFIKSGSTLVWSEEADENLGYEAGGYNNAWDLKQTTSEPITVIIGANEGLYYVRTNGIGIISGAVTPDFQVTGVHDAMSTHIGTLSLTGACLTDTHLWVVDQDHRPWAIPRGGGEPQAAWMSMSRLFSKPSENPFGALLTKADLTTANLARITYQPLTGCVHLLLMSGYTTVWQGRSKYQVLFDATSLLCHGTWSAADYLTHMIPFKVLGGVDLGYGILSATDSGYAMYQVDDFYGGYDATSGYVNYPSNIITLAPLPVKATLDYHFERVDIIGSVPYYTSAPASGGVDYVLDYFTSQRPATNVINAAKSRRVYKVGSSPTGMTVDTKIAIGINGYGRWIAPRIRVAQYADGGAQTTADGAMVQGVKVFAYADAPDPAMS